MKQSAAVKIVAAVCMAFVACCTAVWIGLMASEPWRSAR